MKMMKKILCGFPWRHRVDYHEGEGVRVSVITGLLPVIRVFSQEYILRRGCPARGRA
jgi:hypothetical protein